MRTLPWQVLVWSALIFIAVIFQLQAVARGDRWGQLTSSVRWLRARLVGRLVLFPFFTWLTWHWFLEPVALIGSWWPDLAAIGVGVVFALLLDYDDFQRNIDGWLHRDLHRRGPRAPGS